jgi:hypothetical protein
MKPGGYWVETLSKDPEPRVSLIHNLVTPEEAKHLIFLGAKKGMQKALIIPYGQKHLTQSTTRTNSAAWLDFGQDDVVKKVEKAYAEITGLPEENGENLQVCPPLSRFIASFFLAFTFRPPRVLADPALSAGRALPGAPRLLRPGRRSARELRAGRCAAPTALPPHNSVCLLCQPACPPACLPACLPALLSV